MGYFRGNNGNNKLTGSEGADTIFGLAGDDTLKGEEGADTLIGGTDDDILYGGAGGDVFVYTLGDGDDTIADYEESDRIYFQSGTPSFSVKGNDVVISVGSGTRKGSITVKNVLTAGSFNKTITYLDSNGIEYTYPKVVQYNDSKTAATLLSGYSDDSYDVSALGKDYENVKLIDASAVTQDIEITGTKKANNIIAGTGADTLIGGKGADTLTGGEGNDVFAYASGDGKDVITDYEMGDVVKITSGTLKGVAVVGNDYVISVGNGQITVKNAKDKYLQVEDANGETTWYPEDPVDSLVYYSGGTLSVKKGYQGDVFNVADVESGFVGKVYNIEASGVAQSLHIIANKSSNSIIGTAQDDTIEGLAGADTIMGGKGDDVLYGGAGNDVFVYDKGDGDDQILDYTSGDTIYFRDEDGSFGVTNTVKSGSDLILKLTDKSEITVVGGASKKVKIKSEVIDDGDYMIVGSKGKSVVLLSSYGDDSFDVTGSDYTFADSVMTIDASAVDHDLKITGNKKKNLIVGTGQKDTIDGKAGADTIIGGEGNDILTGGDGADVFVFNSGDGNDRITDYTAEDSISIEGVTSVSTTTGSNGSDIILTLGNNQRVTVVGGASTTITGSLNGTETTFFNADINPTPGPIPIDNVFFNENYTAATLGANFEGESFTPTEYSGYKKLRTIDASKVDHGLILGGNGLANSIVGTKDDDSILGGAGKDTLNGGKGNDSIEGGNGNDKLYGGTGKDTLWGGAGDDQLTGGDANDTFIYNGDGNDRITDYVWGYDKIVCLDSSVSFTNAAAEGNNVVFTTSNGSELTLVNAASKSAKIVDGSGNTLKEYIAR